MKIIHVINSLGGGGAESLLIEIATLQKQLRHDVAIITLNNYDDKHSLKAQVNNIQVINLDTLSRSFLCIPRLRKQFKQLNPDIIHTHLFPTQYHVALATIGLNYKLITTEHATHNKRIDNRLFYLIEKQIYSKYNHIITISKKTYLRYTTYLPNLKNKISLIENGVNLNKFKPQEINKSYLNTASNKFIVTMIARFQYPKDQTTLIQAIALLPDNFELVLVGQGELLEKNQTLTQKLNITNRVYFLGFRNDITNIINASDVIVLSSHWEGLSMSLVEAMACKKPVIGSNVIGVNNILDGYGVLFEQGDYTTLAEQIKNLHDNQEYYHAVAEKCYQRAQDFDINITVKKYLELYENS